MNRATRALYILWMLIAGPAVAAPVEVNIGGFLLPGSTSDALFKDYAAALTAQSSGALLPKLLIYGEAGSEEQVLAGLRRGRIHIGSVSALALSSLIPEMEVTKIPFLFESDAEFDFVVDTVLLGEFQKMLADKNLVVLRWIDLGGLGLFGRKPLVLPDDVRGYRMRATSDVATQVFFKAVGADMAFVAGPEIVPSLQTGLLDGGVTTTTAYAQSGIAPLATHYTLTDHAFLGALLLVNRSWLTGLPAMDAKAVTEAFADNAAIRRFYRTAAARILTEAADHGITIHRLSPEQRAAWVAAVKDSRDPVIAGSGAGGRVLFEKILAGKAAFAAANSREK